METAKSRAEALVRSKIPELMKLSFGCEVRITNSELWRLVGGKVTVGGDYRAHAGDTYIDIAALDLQIKKDNAEIIGHPIQLQHWLRVLRENCDIHFFHKNTIVAVEKGLDIRGLEEFDAIEFNIETGQPFAEADYIAFLTIVGEDKELTD